MAVTFEDEMERLGFTEETEEDVPNRIIMSVSALEKQGKTHFSLTAPDPIGYFDTDIGSEGVVSKFQSDKRIFRNKINTPKDGNVDLAKPEWERFKSSYQRVLEVPDIRSIVFDNATELWELIRLARFGKLTQVKPFHYGPVNAEFRELIRRAYDYDKNLILLHKMKPVYVNDKRQDRYERAGFGDTGFLAQINCEAYRDENGVFHMYVVDCRHNPEMFNMDFEGEMCEFKWIASMMTNTDPSYWE